MVMILILANTNSASPYPSTTVDNQLSELQNHQIGEDGQLTENVEQKYDDQYKNNPNRNVYLRSSALKHIV